MSDEQDALLVTRCLQGDVHAFEPLIEKYQRPIYNAALRFVNCHEDAEDIAQSVFVKAYENLDGYNPKYRFFSWLYRIAVNESINFLNPRKRLVRLDEECASHHKTPEEEFNERETHDNIQKALMSLDTPSRIVIVLRHFQELSYREISYILDIPEKTVKSRLFTARGQLRELLLKRAR